MSFIERVKTKPGYKLLLVIGLMLAVGHIESKETPVAVAPPVAKSAVQARIETILPAEIAEPISKTAYPKTLAAIAHTESRGNHKAVGDHGSSIGLFQIQPKHHGPVPETIEGQVQMADRMFLGMVAQYGYREAVRRWNGSGPAARKYQQVVLAKVRELER